MIISKTPLRVSFFGGGTDFPVFYLKHGGAVLSTTIDKYIYVVVKKRFDDKIVLHYTKTEVCDSVDEIKHDIIREAMRMCSVKKGVEIATFADIPSEGTGLGSSSSLAVGLINALSKYMINGVPNPFLAEYACNLELDILKKPIGKQDQYAAAYGGFNLIEFNTDGSVIVTPQQYGDLESRLMLFYTGITRSAGCILKEQVRNIEDKEQLLIEMSMMPERAIKILNNKIWPSGECDYHEFGRQLHINWIRKTGLAGNITNEYIDDILTRAMCYGGAGGGKICGAGGGGFILLYVRPEFQDSVRQALSDYQELPFKFENEGSKIILEEG